MFYSIINLIKFTMRTSFKIVLFIVFFIPLMVISAYLYLFNALHKDQKKAYTRYGHRFPKSV